MPGILRVALFFLLFALPCLGIEIPTGGSPTSPNDWSETDRISWESASNDLAFPELKSWVGANAENTFLLAAVVNTKENKSGEYRSVRERDAYYGYMSFLLEDGLGPESKEVRFFHVAAAVTSSLELGIADGFTATSLKFIREVNADLFRRNMPVIANLLHNWPKPRDPRVTKPIDPISALDFDIAMVEFEQSAVQDIITSQTVTNKDLGNVTTLASRNPYVFPEVVQGVLPWLQKAGFRKVDFADYRWRVALGRAIIFSFHGKSREEYAAFMEADPPQFRTRAAMYDALMSPTAASADAAGSFTILGSWLTERGANRHAAELREEHFGLQVAVYPPYGNDKYWTVVAAAFAPGDVAVDLQKTAVAEGLTEDAFVLKRAAIDSAGELFLPDPRSLNLDPPNFLIAAASEVVPEGKRNVLTIYRGADEAIVRTRLEELKALYPTLAIAMVKLTNANEYGIALATFVDERQLAAAVDIAQMLAVPLSDIRIDTLADPKLLERIGITTSAQATWDLVTDCYGKGNLSIEALHACSGLWATPQTLTRCVLQSDCRLLDDAILSSDEAIASFLSAQGLKLTDELQLAVGAIPLPADGRVLARQIQDCRNRAQGQLQPFVECMYSSSADPTAIAALNCSKGAATTAVLLTCIANGAGEPELARIAACVTTDSADPINVSRCLLGPAAGALNVALDCLTRAEDQGEALTSCVGGLLTDSDARKVNCLVASSGDPIATASCAIPDSTEKKVALAALACSQRSSDVTKVGLCLTGLTGGDVGKIAQCAASAATNTEMLDCVLGEDPRLGTAVKVFKCVSEGTDMASVVAGCSANFVDPQTAQLASCVGQSRDAYGAMGCAAGSILPKELGPVVRCASQSSGGVDFALCMAGPNMNAEWRIAAECAANSGGEPISFAGCTAGRLTVRELTKCLTGKIGEDCFGPGNTIVAAVNTVVGDLTSCVNGGPCLGPNNEFVKAGKAVETAVADVGHALEDLWDEFTRGDVGKVICGWFGC